MTNKYLEKIAERDFSRAGEDGRWGLIGRNAAIAGSIGSVVGGAMDAATHYARPRYERARMVLTGKSRIPGLKIGLGIGALAGGIHGASLFSRYRGATPEEMDEYYRSQQISNLEGGYQAALGAKILEEELRRNLAKERIKYLLATDYSEE